jgi:hypothetical protein
MECVESSNVVPEKPMNGEHRPMPLCPFAALQRLESYHAQSGASSKTDMISRHVDRTNGSIDIVRSTRLVSRRRANGTHASRNVPTKNRQEITLSARTIREENATPCHAWVRANDPHAASQQGVDAGALKARRSGGYGNR